MQSSFLRFSFVTSSALVVFAGCASVDTTRLQAAEPRPRLCALDTYASESRVQRPHERLCVIEVETSSWGDRSTAYAVEKAKPRACECGADAIFVEAASASRGGVGMATVVAIRYTNAAASN